MSPALEVSATGDAASAVAEAVPGLVEERFASRLFLRDAGLWGSDAEPEAAQRLGWVDLHRTSRPLLGEIRALRAELVEAGVDRIVLCGMGGSSLAPEVICRTAGVPLTVLDSSDPDQVRGALGRHLERTAVVVSSKSGSTVETDSHKRIFEGAFRARDIDPVTRIVVVTDPGSPLDQSARADGYRVVNADADVGGRYSALTAFGLVPSGLAGADIEELLDDAETVADLLADDDEGNPALRLGAALAATRPVRDKIVIVDEGMGVPGFGDWAEQLIAESTGKQGKGLLPVVVEGPEAPELQSPADDMTIVRLTPDVDDDPEGDASSVRVTGPLGAQFVLWETAVAVAGRLLGINPFDQPDVESAKQAARDLLERTPDAAAASFVDAGVEVRALGNFLGGASSLTQAVTALLSQLDEHSGYLAVMAYLDREENPDLAKVRAGLARRTHRPVTFGWGPRFLHSTGQFHKGGPAKGVYLQITGAAREDLDIPGRKFTLGEFIAAQAAGDAAVLADHGRPVLRLHVLDQVRGLAAVREALT